MSAARSFSHFQCIGSPQTPKELSDMNYVHLWAQDVIEMEARLKYEQLFLLKRVSKTKLVFPHAVPSLRPSLLIK
jgi:hypothetical protein